ncbi:hypothetical protein, partial [Actinomadura sp. LOL_011]|uniref:hypothetical protein n=1 Tax=Actinomadura sp. LOL_011 TaxID=3345410 RepID=UPI003A7FEABD
AFDPSLLAYFRRRLARSTRLDRVFEAVRAVISVTGMPCADSSTVCARRQVTTDPVPLRMIRSRRRPSSSSISRTRTRSATRSE